MRPTPLRFALVAVALAVVAGIAPAQFGFKPKAKIDKVRIGFRPTSGGERDAGAAVSPVCKTGLWAPVSVGVEFGDMKGYKKGVLLEVTTVDCDDLRTISRFPIIPAISAEPDSDEFLRDRGPGARKEPSELTNTAYVKLPSDTAEVRLRLVQEDDPEKALSETEPISRTGVRSTAKYVVLTLGGKLPGFTLATPANFGQRLELAHLDSIQEMPDQWFGYEGADLIVLPTGGPRAEFIADLFTSENPVFARKRRALFEWVRRGGKLVVSVGDRAAEVAASPEFMGYEDKATKEWVPGILPVQVTATPKVEGLRVSKSGTLSSSSFSYSAREVTTTQRDVIGKMGGSAALVTVPDKLPPARFAIASLKVNQKKTPFSVFLSGETRIGEKWSDKLTLGVQTPFGLGRVTVLAFDIDRSPFTDEINRNWRGEFWQWLVAEAGDHEACHLPVSQQKEGGKPADDFNPNRPRGMQGQQPTYSTNRDGEDGIVSALRGNVDHYDEVPVISFGWVALFILGYTLIIGPIEYILLKKLFGRLELTWITFPIIVLTVSGAAYATAYMVKGQDLRMNKIDVVDIDLRTDPARPRVYGRTWFTIFSPRIDSYTVGVEPKENWARTRDDRGYSPVTTVDWFGLPKQGGVTAGSRGYTYEIDPRGDNSPQANGVSGVPIQVWSTKAFVANWAGVTDPDAPPVKTTFQQLPAGGLEGTITYNLTLKDVDQAFAIYKGKVYPFQKAVLPGVPVNASQIEGVHQVNGGQTAETVFRNDDQFTYREKEDDQMGGFGRSSSNKPKTTGNAANKNPLDLWGMLFHEKVSLSKELNNGALRPLDQSWRLSEANDSEVILLFKLKRATKQDANALMTDADSPSPTRVWMHGLPGQPNAKWEAKGIVQQDTYVRMYLPVKPAGAK